MNSHRTFSVARPVLLLSLAFMIGPAHADLPAVNIFAPISSVSEGEPAYFIFTSSQSDPLTVYFALSGSAGLEDIGVLQSTNQVTIPGGGLTKAFAFRAQSDLILEGPEIVTATILPDPSYQLGSSSSAAIEIRDASVWAETNAPIIYFTSFETNFVATSPITFNVGATDTNSENLDIELLVDGIVIDQVFRSAQSSAPATLTWSNPTAGGHVVQAIAFNDRGVSAATAARQILVAFEILKPASQFTITDAGSSVTQEVVLFRGSGSEFLGFVEFDLPAAATNRQALLIFHSDVTDSFDAFAYAAGPTSPSEIIQIPRDFIHVFESNSPPTLQLDLTTWSQKYAGSRLGIAFRLSPAARLQYDWLRLADFSLLLVPQATYDASPRVRWATEPPRILHTNSVTFSAEIVDADSAITRTYVFDGPEVLAVDAPDQPYGASTNRISFQLTNLAPGFHLLNLRTVSRGQSVASDFRPIFIETSDVQIASHQWIGSQNNSASFYVVDAAGRAHVWGRNLRGQLGLGFTMPHDYGVKRPVTLIPPDGLRFRQIASASTFAVALMDDGSLYAWGTNSATPKRVPMPPGAYFFKKIAVTEKTAIALDQSNASWVWYYGFESLPTWNNQVVDVRTSSRDFMLVLTDGRLPLNDFPVAAIPVRDYSLGPEMYAIGNDGQLYRWNAKFTSNVTVNVPGVTGWRRVVASDRYTLAIDQSERLWEWDRVSGSSEAILVHTPKAVTNWLDIAATSSFAMALSDTGELYAWGTAAPGVWTDPFASVAATPEIVSGLPDLLDPHSTRIAAAFLPTYFTPTTVTLNMAAPAGIPISIQVSDDLRNWTPYTNLISQSTLPTVGFPIDETGRKFFRVAP